MQKLTFPTSFRAFTAAALAINCVVFALPKQSTAAAPASIEVKSEAQYRTEAGRFTRAVSAIAEIATMKLETGDDLKRAIAILDRERPNLKFHRAKLIVLALSDSTFTGAVKKRAPDLKSAETLEREVKADPKTVLKLEGVASLTSRMKQSAEADAATLRRVALRLKEAAEKIRRTNLRNAENRFERSNEFTLTRISFTSPVDAEYSVTFPQVETVLIIIFATALAAYIGGYILGRVSSIDLAEISDCQEDADDQYRSCMSSTGNLPSGIPFFQREVATAMCYGEWLLSQAVCTTLR